MKKNAQIDVFFNSSCEFVGPIRACCVSNRSVLTCFFCKRELYLYTSETYINSIGSGGRHIDSNRIRQDHNIVGGR